MYKFLDLCLQAFVFVFPPVIGGFVTLPWTHKLSKGNFYLQSVYLAGLRLVWTIFALAFLKDIIMVIKNLF